MTAKIWTPPDVVILIAWLEFCLQNQINFEANIIELLRESRKRQTGQEYPFTFKQVKDKLVDLARRDADPKGESKEYARLDEILLKGSTCFPRRVRELQPRIDMALEQFHESCARSKPQRARQSDQQFRERTVPEARLPEDFELADRPAPEEMLTPRAFPNMITSNAPQDPTNGSSLGFQTVAPRGPTFSQPFTTATTPSKSRKRIDIRKGYSIRQGAWHRSRITGTQHDAVRMVERLWEEDATSLHGQIAELEKDKQKLLAMLQNSDNARQHCESAGQDPKESQFRLYHQQIWELQQLNLRLERAADFFDLDASQSRSVQVGRVDESIEQIQSELESILGSCDITNLQLSTAIKHGSDLEALLLSCLDLHETPELLDLRLKECISQFEAPILVRTLVLAALNDWVFDTSFPPFMSEGPTSLYLKSIEEIALDHRDWAWLRNLETAAYSRFLERSEFKEGLLPMNSKLLADRLSNAIAFFIIPVSLESSLAAGNQVIDPILESLHSRFIELFSAGLKFKAATAATDNRYEFVLKRPGTLTAEKSREIAPRCTSATQERSQRRDVNRAWFHASLRVYDSGPANWLNPRFNAIIQTDNFVPGISETNCKCIYNKDITVERSDIRLGDSSLQTHGFDSNSISSQQEPFEPPSIIPSIIADPGPSICGRIDDALERRTGRSAQHLSAKSTDDRPEQNMTASLLAKEISRSEDRPDKGNGSLSDLTSAEDPYEADVHTTTAEVQATRSERTILDKGTLAAQGTVKLHVCRTCGAPLSSLDCLRRHERNESCRRCNICERKFPSNTALKKHQELDHFTNNKRQRLSQDGSFVNRENAEPNNTYVCKNCNHEFNQAPNLQRHLLNKSCSKCYKCGRQFDTANEFYSHMKISHGLQLIESRWRRLAVEGAEESLGSLLLPIPSTSEEISQKDTSNQARHVRETRILPPAHSKNGEARATVGAGLNLENFQVAQHNREPSPLVSTEDKYHCSICNETFTSQYGLERHKGRQSHRVRVRETKKASAFQRQGSPNRPKLDLDKGQLQDRTHKTRIEKQARSRASTEMRREPTPPSRHITRIMESLAKVDENRAVTSSQRGNQQQTGSTATSISQDQEASRTISETEESDCRAATEEKAQVLKAPAHFGG